MKWTAMIDKMLENVECHLDDIEMVIFIMLPSVIHPIWRRMNILQFSPYLALLVLQRCKIARHLSNCSASGGLLPHFCVLSDLESNTPLNTI